MYPIDNCSRGRERNFGSENLIRVRFRICNFGIGQIITSIFTAKLFLILKRNARSMKFGQNSFESQWSHFFLKEAWYEILIDESLRAMMIGDWGAQVSRGQIGFFAHFPPWLVSQLVPRFEFWAVIGFRDLSISGKSRGVDWEEFHAERIIISHFLPSRTARRKEKIEFRAVHGLLVCVGLAVHFISVSLTKSEISALGAH